MIDSAFLRGSLRYALAASLVACGVVLSAFDTVVGAAMFVPAIGVVCARRREVAEVVTSEKVAEEKPVVEEWTPEVEIPRAELAELPIETIEGIGPVYGKKLRDAGIETVQDLLASKADEVAKICGVGEAEAQRWIAMSRFCWLESISEEDAEAIVYAGGISTLKELAEADPEQLLRDIQEGVELGHVQVPEGYEFTLEMVKKWIEEAKDLTKE
ncbi:MAG: DUF4332 domain-containing protein [Candidatus Thorarchaeota archaeon]